VCNNSANLNNSEIWKVLKCHDLLEESNNVGLVSALEGIVGVCREFKCPDLLEEEVVQSVSEVDNKIAMVMGYTGGEKRQVIMDSGSQISFIALGLYNDLVEGKSEDLLADLPLRNLSIVGVTGVKSKKARRQILMRIRFEDRDMEIQFVVIEGVTVDILIGVDFLREAKAVLDFEKNSVRLLYKGEQVNIDMIRGARDLKNVCRFLGVDEQQVAWDKKIEQIREYKLVDDEEINKINKVNDLINIFESKRDIFLNNLGKF
jgi:hypothetical protein